MATIFGVEWYPGEPPRLPCGDFDPFSIVPHLEVVASRPDAEALAKAVLPKSFFGCVLIREYRRCSRAEWIESEGDTIEHNGKLWAQVGDSVEVS